MTVIEEVPAGVGVLFLFFFLFKLLSNTFISNGTVGRPTQCAPRAFMLLYSPVCLLTGSSHEHPNLVYSNCFTIARANPLFSFFFFLSCHRCWDNFCLRQKVNFKLTPPKNKRAKEMLKILLTTPRLPVSGFMGTISSVFKTWLPENS